jgi:hypothetical protein
LAARAASATSSAALAWSNPRKWSRSRGRVRRSLSIFGHLQREILDPGLLLHGHLLMRGGESQDFHLDVPHAGSEVQIVASVFVGVANHFGVALSGGDGRSGDGLVSRVNRPALLSRIQKSESRPRSQEYKNRKTHRASSTEVLLF